MRKGETYVFVAAEFIEAQYAGAPHLKYGHLSDICKASDTSSNTKTSKWVYMRLGEMFYYGQDRPIKPSFRFLVYHPFYRPRKMAQVGLRTSLFPWSMTNYSSQAHFMPSTMRDKARKAIDVAKDSSSHFLAELGAFVGGTATLVLNAWKDPLRQFDHIHPQTAPYLPVITEKGKAQDPPMVVVTPQLTKQEVQDTMIKHLIEMVHEDKIGVTIQNTLQNLEELRKNPLAEQNGSPELMSQTRAFEIMYIKRLLEEIEEQPSADDAALNMSPAVATQRAGDGSTEHATLGVRDKTSQAQQKLTVSIFCIASL
jgi:hypothetical protein